MPEPITVILLTWERTDYALRTIAAAREYLRYPDLRWIVADDGSRSEHVAAVAHALEGEDVIGVSTERRGYGGNANAAWGMADGLGALTLFLEDDWVLTQPLDLYPYAALLMEREDIGMVRLGYMSTGVVGTTIGHGGVLYWSLDRVPAHEGTPVFTGHPSLRHRRYKETYGPYPEGLAPGVTELEYALRYRWGSGPGIVYPAWLGEWGIFSHIGDTKCENLPEYADVAH